MPARRHFAATLAMLCASIAGLGFTEPDVASSPEETPRSGEQSPPKSKDSSGNGESKDSPASEVKDSPKIRRERSPRVLLITKDDCENCDAELKKLRLENGTFDELKRQRWKIGETVDCHIQIVNAKDIPEFVKKLGVQEYPTVACLSNGEIIRSFTKGCRTPLDVWTFGWLLHGRDERLEPLLDARVTVDWTGHYPLRGNHWSVEGEWLPTFEFLVEHMRGENHLTQVPSRWPIETWSYDEVRSLHDDVHETNGLPRHPLKRYRLSPPLPESKPAPKDTEEPDQASESPEAAKTEKAP